MKLVKKDKNITKTFIFITYLLHWIHYSSKIDDCESIYSVNPLYLFVNHANGYIEEKNGKKNLIFDDS